MSLDPAIKADNQLPDLSACEDEPIHLPGSIQPHGALLALHGPTLRVTQASSTCETLLGVALADLLDHDLETVFGLTLTQATQDALRRYRESPPDPVSFCWQNVNRTFSGYIHESDDQVVLELEPVVASDWALSEDLTQILRGFNTIRTHAELPARTQAAADWFRRLTGYDRVMIYRFDQDWHGEVIAEARRTDLEPYLGLHYPASDIPVQARRLYRINLIRVIADIDYTPAPLLPMLNPLSRQPLDLSYSLLRSVSPVHIAYLRNMGGVRATLTVSLIHDGQLWGLIACHHYTPRRISWKARELTGWIAQDLATQIVLLEETRHRHCVARLKQCRENVIHAMRQGAGLAELLCGPEQTDLLCATRSEGVALIRGATVITSGVTPDPTQIRAIAGALNVRQSSEVDLFVTDCLSEHVPELADLATTAAGVAMVSLDTQPATRLIWFRGERLRHITWGGNPDQAVNMTAEDRLSPRQSFAAWTQIVRLHSVRWTPEEIESTRYLAVLLDIEMRRRMEEEQRRFVLAVEQSPLTIVITNLEGRIEYVNPRFTEITGYSATEAMGQNPRILKSGSTPSEHYQAMWRAISSGQRWQGTLQNRKKNGELYWERISISPILNDHGQITHYLGIKENITPLKAAEDALRASEERFRDLSTMASDWFWEQDDQFRFTYFSTGSTMSGIESTGIDPANLLGKTRWQMPIDLTPRQWAAHRKMLKAHRSFRDFEYPVRTESGETRWFSINGRPLFNAEGRFIGYRGTGRDITEHKQNIAALSKAKEMAEQAAQAKAQFLANMSHEIRTPMTAIMGMVDLSLKTELTGKQRHFLIRTQEAAAALLRIINDILDFSRIEAGKLPMECVAFDFKRVLAQVKTLLAPSAQEKGLRLVFDLDTELPSTLWGDPGRLNQVLVNLVHNAIKFSSTGEIVVTVRPKDQQQDRLTLHVTVRDQGIGLTSEQQAQLFTAFSQADTSTTRRFGGTGLGLAISRRLVEMMAGRIWVESIYGQGSLFHFTVQLPTYGNTSSSVTGLTGTVIEHLSIDKAAAIASLQGADILLVEDNELNQDVVRSLLEHAGLQVRLAHNGVEALRAVEAVMPDAVLMDCQMPVMDGFEASRQLRAQARYQTLPIIALTASAMASDRDRCLAAGMNTYVAKPVNINELLMVLAQSVRPWNAAKPATSLPLPPLPEIPADTGHWPELPGIDIYTGLDLTGGEPEFYLEMLQLFRDTQGQRFAPEMQAAIAAGDWPAAAGLAHALKSVAKTLGAFRLGQCAAQLEAAARTTQPEQTLAQLPSTLLELDQVIAGLARLTEITLPGTGSTSS